RDRIEALEHVVDRMRRLERLRGLEACLVVPGPEPGWRKAFFVSGGGGRAGRPPPPRGGVRAEGGAALRLCPSPPWGPGRMTPEQAEDGVLLDGFVRKPPAELTVQPLDPDRITAHLSRESPARLRACNGVLPAPEILPARAP